MKKKTTTQHLLTIAGGIGKNVLATAVVASMRAAEPEANITIATAYPFVWDHNPDVHAVYDLNNCPTLYTEAIKGKKWTIFKHDPYHTEDFLYRRGHLIDIWCKLIGVPVTTHEPRLYLSADEEHKARTLLPKDNKPIFLIQTSGGIPTIQKYPISWARDLPLDVAQNVVDTMNTRGYHTIHLRHAKQPALEHTTWIDATTRQLMAIIPHSSKRLFIDSFPQHAAAAFKKPAVVTWIVNSPKMFGYALHRNLETTATPLFRHYPTSYLERFDITGAIEQFPFATTKTFDAKTLLAALDDIS